MNVRRRVRNVLVGKAIVDSRLEFKSAMLRGYMAWIALTVGVVYTLVDVANGVSSSFIYYFCDILLSLITLALNRRHKFQAANLVFLVTFNLLIFLFASSDLYRTGIYMFFLCISISAMALMGIRRVKYAIFFGVFSLFLFFLSYWGKFSVMTPLTDERYIDIYFTMNFLVALTTCILVVYSLISINHYSEAKLLQTTEELRQSRERNEMVVDAVNAGIYEWRPNVESIYISATWKRLLGYEEDELPAVTLEFYYSILHPDDRARVQQKMKDHFAHHTPYFNELRIRKKSGEYNWFQDSGDSRFDETGQPLVTVGSIIDINDRKQAEEKILQQNVLLTKTNQELDQFVYSVSHDLRAPLSSIQGLTHVYELTNNALEKDAIVKHISDRANTLDEFIREILDYSRNARTELKLLSVQPRLLIQEILESLQHMSGIDRVRILNEVPLELEIDTDRERLKVILTNLITNAIKYSNPAVDSYVRLTSSVAGPHWILKVEDNGLGIDSIHLDRIFEMFYQAHAHALGSGLGLYIATEAVQRLSGSIQVTSKLGAGSTFTLTIPHRRLADRD